MWAALDTATDVASVALAVAPGEVLEDRVAGARSHARAILPLLDVLLRRAGRGPAALTGILVADGPGSFTGLRVGAAVAKALVATRGVELRTAPSLLGRAAAAAQAAPDGGAPVLAVSDALRGELYAMLVRFTPGAVETLLAPRVWRPDALVTVLEQRGAALGAIVGDVPAAIRERLEAWSGLPATTSPAGAASAAALLALLAREGGTRRPADPRTWEPEYGRPAEAQARWESAHGRPLPSPAGAGG
ncbi:MAG TPA: tRNA (adenosine(37)-N6)-threonylcarbamoyltransferase complex dimerization subunit type 1 TsaB [Gemmatimonadales bacterium]|nr:tRNA (adenosine(37)-N6)-threonylcarbamoyltransferase complex dimerization subunit type 1 TsaB [Gemmatimonadales bacterium]